MTLTTPTAAALLIGNELLSGRTQDGHLQTIARFLAPFGIPVIEARVVPDRPSAIVEAARALSASATYVFSTGGIGPTHDDITADAMAEAFGVGIDVRADARALLQAHYARQNVTLNPARLRMARIPDGASLIANPVSAAPGFQIGNVFVLAGVPNIMRAMLEDVAPRIAVGTPVLSRTVRGEGVREGEFAEALGALAARYPDIDIGSYPHSGPNGVSVQLVARGIDSAQLADVAEQLKRLLCAVGASPVEV
jgi:molybdenum cofactor synthesis domain-containing protein